jgi:Uma2 family endonuclease
MSTVAKILLSPREYLERERRAEFRSEFCRGEMFAMSGGSWEHALVKDNLAGEARNQLKDGPCRVVTSDLRVKVDASGLYAYPDVVFVCDAPQFEDDMADTLLNPRAIVDVLSESTEKYDRGLKFANYRQVPSLKEYVLVSQDRFLVERYLRQDDGTWVLSEFADPAQTFAFSSIGVRIPLGEIYRGVQFPEDAARPKPGERPV